MSEWISVKGQLPDKNTVCAVADGHGCRFVATYEGNHVWTIGGDMSVYVEWYIPLPPLTQDTSDETSTN